MAKIPVVKIPVSAGQVLKAMLHFLWALIVAMPWWLWPIVIVAIVIRVAKPELFRAEQRRGRR